MHTPARKSDFTRRALTNDGYVGWTPFAALRQRSTAVIDEDGGTYVVVRVTNGPPTFLRESPAGHFKGENPTVPVQQLRANWVAGARVLYIGKGDDLDVRVRCMAAFGAGKRVAHRGGRLVWQLKESAQLLVAWRRVRPSFTPKTDEDDMIARFREAYGQPPFANYPDRMGR